tara:strand:- start:1175 stop:2278 length:1104 start_codon:yes stop_codon:yes gene_type:complete
MEIATILGARPQFIKAAVVSKIIKLQDKMEEIIIHTGQHYDDKMSNDFFDELEIPMPIYNLGIGSSSHGEQTGRMICEIEKVLLKEKPHLVLLYGDTNSTLAGALAASKIHIKIVHIEAGLRSFNKAMPEEINRLITDRVSDILFCPTVAAVENLKNEGIKEGVYLVGDVMCDSILQNKVCSKVENKIFNKFNINGKDVESRYILATIHRPENTDYINNLSSIFKAMSKMKERIILPLHPRTRNVIKNENLFYGDNIKIVDPLPYKEILGLEKNAYLILTDSGGIQKEAFLFNVPCITLRDETEWVETVENGMNKLTGHSEKRILKAYNEFCRDGVKKLPDVMQFYGGGNAAYKIVEVFSKIFLNEK